MNIGVLERNSLASDLSDRKAFKNANMLTIKTSIDESMKNCLVVVIGEQTAQQEMHAL